MLKEQLRRAHLKRQGQLLNDRYRRVSGAPFDVADIGPVDAGRIGEPLLAEPFLFAEPPQVLTKALPDVHGALKTLL